MGRGYQPFDTKESALGDYRFSVVIENTREAGYFSEKLIDCLICETLPIYWGAPDIEHFFDSRGMIICRTEAEVMHAIRQTGEGRIQPPLPMAAREQAARVAVR